MSLKKEVWVWTISQSPEWTAFLRSQTRRHWMPPCPNWHSPEERALNTQLQDRIQNWSRVGRDWYCHVRQMSWHSFPSSSVLGCLRSSHASAKLETGACCNWNIITTKQDYHEQRFQMGLEMILCYSEIISHSSSSGEASSPEYFSGGMALVFQALGQHPCPPFLAGKYWALSWIGQRATWDKGWLHIKES